MNLVEICHSWLCEFYLYCFYTFANLHYLTFGNLQYGVKHKNNLSNGIMVNKEIQFLPYTATSISIVGRFIFMYLLYKNKSTNSLSLIFCILNIFSSSMWIYYSTSINDRPMITRSSSELVLLFLSSIYIIRNKYITYRQGSNVLPT